MSNIIESNAARIQELNEAIKSAYKKRSEGPRQMQQWRDACRIFHESYDSLAFPGGLNKAMTSLKKKDPAAVEMAIKFLEADPWFFRSGYIKQEVIRHLKAAPLTAGQQIRLRYVILARIQGRDTREFRSYCRLAPFVTNPSFEEQVADLAASRTPLVSRHAKWVLAILPRQRQKVSRKQAR